MEGFVPEETGLKTVHCDLEVPALRTERCDLETKGNVDSSMQRT